MAMADAILAGRNAALQQMQVASDLEERKFRRDQVLEALAGVRGLSQEDVAGVMERDPTAIRNILVKPGGMAVLPVLDRLIPTAAELRAGRGDVPMVPVGMMGGFNQFLETGSTEGLTAPGMPSDIPASLMGTAVAGRGGVAGRDISAEATMGAAGLRSVSAYDQSQVALFSALLDQLKGQSADQDRVAQATSAFGDDVANASLGIMTNLQFPKQNAQALASMIKLLATAKYGELVAEARTAGTTVDPGQFVSDVVTELGLKPKMSKREMREAMGRIAEELSATGAESPQALPAPQPPTLLGPGGRKSGLFRTEEAPPPATAPADTTQAPAQAPKTLGQRVVGAVDTVASGIVKAGDKAGDVARTATGYQPGGYTSVLRPVNAMKIRRKVAKDLRDGKQVVGSEVRAYAQTLGMLGKKWSKQHDQALVELISEVVAQHKPKGGEGGGQP